MSVSALHASATAPSGSRRFGPPPGVLRWTASVAVVLALHASFLLVIRRAAPDAGERSSEPILLDLAPAPAAPPTLPQPTEAEIPPIPQASEPLPPDLPSPEKLPLVPPPPQEPLALAPPEPPLVAETPPLPEMQQATAPLEPPRPPIPKPAVRPAPRPQRLPSPPAVARTAPVTPPAPAPALSAPAAPAPGPAAAPPSGEVAAVWQSRLIAHLARFKRFPMEAQRRGEQGVVLMRFSMDRAGHVLSAAMVRGSGYADLDAEAEAWIRRADPMPALPSDLPQSHMDLVVPLRFNLR